ncbi:hypothetical protein LV457_07630 [Mycobacterium sp. MYCO198283]|uniref:hypothetical protein n=1 Tax=Mycobacterium sp. MYCO198283 TaxID=2883505 RepID=UPI001E5FAA68|nr:hypothetical protein [Mycobacterium sp. MYCO198283]MCG5432162.1 hypothetical protein [Mycobacterium sp. MYCO198283]
MPEITAVFRAFRRNAVVTFLVRLRVDPSLPVAAVLLTTIVVILGLVAVRNRHPHQATCSDGRP